MLDYGRRTPDLVMLDDHKVSSGHLYVADHKPYAVQIIQLVEAQPPPRTDVSSCEEPSDYYSESMSSSSEDDEESDCSSYCSSDLPPEEMEDSSAADQRYTVDASPDTYSIRMKRILAWREDFSSHMSTTLHDPSLSSPLKRKIDNDDDDLASQSSKRSRSQSENSSASLGEHSCPACDASFDSRQSLRLHGRDAQANEACCVAVDYAFE